MPIVSNSVLDPGGHQAKGTVKIRLVAATSGQAPGFLSSTGRAIEGFWTAPIRSGHWSVSLFPNVAGDAEYVEFPAGTVYEITERLKGGSRYLHVIEVRNEVGPFTVSDLLAELPASLPSSALQTHLDDTTAHRAEDIPTTPSGGLAGTNVAAQLVELDTEKEPSGAYRPGGTDVAVADGGTGASTAAVARTNLGAAAQTDLDEKASKAANLSDLVDLAAAAKSLDAAIGALGSGLNVYRSMSREVTNPKEWGAIADGTLHPISERYGSLAAAQADYPHVLSLDDSIDWAAVEGAKAAAVSSMRSEVAPGLYHLGENALTFPISGFEFIGLGGSAQGGSEQGPIFLYSGSAAQAWLITCDQLVKIIGFTLHNVGASVVTNGLDIGHVGAYTGFRYVIEDLQIEDFRDNFGVRNCEMSVFERIVCLRAKRYNMVADQSFHSGGSTGVNNHWRSCRAQDGAEEGWWTANQINPRFTQCEGLSNGSGVTSRSQFRLTGTCRGAKVEGLDVENPAHAGVGYGVQAAGSGHDLAIYGFSLAEGIRFITCSRSTISKMELSSVALAYNISDAASADNRVFEDGFTGTDNGTRTRIFGTRTKRAGVLLEPVLAVTASLTLDSTHSTILADASAGVITVTLPAAAGVNRGTVYRIKKTDASANAVTVDPNAAELIDGASTLALTSQQDSIVIQSDGIGWMVTARQSANPQRLIKLTDQIVNNSTTRVDDNRLAASIPANKAATGRFVLYVKGDATADFKAMVSVGEFAVFSRRLSDAVMSSEPPAGNVITAGTAGAAVMSVIEILFSVASSAGAQTATLSWAQQVATVADLTVLAGSYVEWFLR